MLELTTAKGASYQLAADSGAECHAWVSSIQARARLASEATTTRAAWLHMLGGPEDEEGERLYFAIAQDLMLRYYRQKPARRQQKGASA